jgi:hypothetical protein
MAEECAPSHPQRLDGSNLVHQAIGHREAERQVRNLRAWLQFARLWQCTRIISVQTMPLRHFLSLSQGCSPDHTDIHQFPGHSNHRRMPSQFRHAFDRMTLTLSKFPTIDGKLFHGVHTGILRFELFVEIEFCTMIDCNHQSFTVSVHGMNYHPISAMSTYREMHEPSIAFSSLIGLALHVVTINL